MKFILKKKYSCFNWSTRWWKGISTNDYRVRSKNNYFRIGKRTNF